MATNVQLVVFDLAGTTVHDNQDVARILQAVLRGYDISISLKEAARVMGIPKPVAIRSLLQTHSPKEINDKLIAEIHHQFVKEMQAFYRESPTVKEMDGASLVFTELGRARIKVAVDTGFDRAITNQLLDRMGWIKNGLVAASVTSDEVQFGRPNPAMIFKAMEIAGVADVSRVGKVGDTASDLQEGTSAGCGLVVGVTTGAYTREELSKYPHHYLIDSLVELLPLVGL